MQIPSSPDEHLKYAEIILPLNFPNTLTYGIPVALQGKVLPGMRVEVALRDNKFYSGMVLRLHNDTPDAYSVRPVRALLDRAPVLNDRQLAFWTWVSEYYMATPGEVMHAALPAHLKLANETKFEWTDTVSPDEAWSNEAHLAVEQLLLRKVLTVSELKSITGAEKFHEVIYELIERQAVWISEGLEQSYKPRLQQMVFLDPKYKSESALQTLFDRLQRAPMQLEVLMRYLSQVGKNDFVLKDALCEKDGAKSAALKAMAAKNIFVLQEGVADRIAANDKAQIELTLSPEQATAVEEIEQVFSEKDVCLLQGVTASGKTSVYVELIKRCIAKGEQALFLLPEIGIATQLMSRLQQFFGNDLGVYHSRFSDNERVEIWEKVRRQEYKVVVGTRSALWLPFQNLKLIVIDEEHDASYKQQELSPRFHARDAGIFLAKLLGAKTLLGSATPSVESLWNVQQAKYGFASLLKRFGDAALPDVEIVGAKPAKDFLRVNIRMLGPELLHEMDAVLRQQKQVILFQNKRGYTPFQICRSCGWVPQCVNCSVSLTYHKSTDKLHCHYCGLKVPPVSTCVKCGSFDLEARSFGTQKLEEEVSTVFPKARIARMDTDSTRGKQNFSLLIDKLAAGAIDVLIGTQMVVKGLDFPNVALVGIVSADSILSFPDFRVNERAFQTMSQVSGRAGRSAHKGKVLIQAFNPAHPVFQQVREHDLKTFYRNEIEKRAAFHYPPLCKLIKVLCKHNLEEKAAQAAEKMATAMSGFSDDLIVQGAVPALVARVRNKYIYEIWIKFPLHSGLLPSAKIFLKEARAKVQAAKGFSGVQIIFDVDPV